MSGLVTRTRARPARRRGACSLLVAAALPVAMACVPSDEADSPRAGAALTAGVVEIVARDLTLDAPDTIPSGWTTFRFTNTSPMIHFALVERLPDGVGIEEQQEQVAPVFQEGLERLAEGEVEAALAAFSQLPAWFGEIAFMGGPGLTSPGRTSQASVYLEPGTYLLECYVKTDGVFHSFNPDPAAYGMVHEFTVTDDRGDAPEPTSTLRLTISAEDGISMEGTPEPGEHTVAVEFADQTVHENFVGHDLHVVRLADDVDLQELERWMDWSRPTGLQTPAPAEFLGGTNELPAGTTGYFTVTLEPGEHAWVAEVPGSAAKGMLVRFSVRE